jgi:hypothetical protein
MKMFRIILTSYNSISQLYAECLFESIDYFCPDVKDAKYAFIDEYDKSWYSLYDNLPKGVKIYLNYTSKDEKYQWLNRLNQCYDRLLM